MKSLMVSGTPWECHEVYDDDNVWPIWVKREDLCCEPPGPHYSKMRGLEIFLNGVPEGTPVGVQDAGYHSRSGWGTAYLCSGLGMPCFDFYPVYKRELIDKDGGFGLGNHELREFQVNAQELGATLVPQRAGRAKMLWYQARTWMKENTDNGIMLPAGLKLKESAIGTSIEVMDYTPDELFAGTWLVSISSGTVAAGVLLGIEEYIDNITLICHMGSSKNESKVRKHMCDLAGYDPGEHLVFVDEGYGYSESLDYPIPFPSSIHYEVKLWKWLMENIDDLEPPVCFWNIGD